MRFIVLPHRRSVPDKPKVGACYLLTDNWDDYSFRTSYVLEYVQASGETKTLGSVKITEKGQAEATRTSLSDSFETLDETYCSLGQAQSYYEELMALPKKIRVEILKGLRDCIHDVKIFEAFKNEEAMKVSLQRSISEKSIQLFRSILKGHAVLTPYDFRFNLENDDVGIEVRVEPHSTPPTNVHVIIGRNGVGKTRMLAGIASCLTGNSEDNYSLPGQIEFQTDLDFSNSKFGKTNIEPQFANLVTVAFSAFDKFIPIRRELIQGDIRYDYIGLRSPDDPEHLFKNPDELESEFVASLDSCLGNLRKSRWIDAINVLNSDPIFAEHDIAEIADEDGAVNKISKIFKNLSSGHKIILLSITRLVALVDERTLVLVDEPETHLHPPLLSSFTRALSNLLIQRNGVAIIATHSPVVLQEVPKSCVTIINKVRSKYGFTRPEIETFGENVGTLTREVFKLEVMESGFYKMINDNLQTLSYEDLLRKFDNQIGAEGRTIARAISAIKTE